MPALSNPRHERFAQEIAQGASATVAYVKAGYSHNEGNAGRLNRNEHVRARVQEILREGAERAGVTVQRVVEELAKIGFSDIRKAIEWHGHLVQEEDNPDGGDVLVIRNIFSNHVRLIDSDKIDNSTAAAIAEVRQTKEGLAVKLHDKRAALVDLGKHLGMFKEQHEHSGPGGGPIETKDVSDHERARALAAFLAKTKASSA